MPTPLPKHRSAILHLQRVVRLTRWSEHVLFTVPVTLLGAVAALHRHTAPSGAGERALLVLVANALAVTFAFMLNDLEDAPDDARDPARRARNIVASGHLGRHAALGWTLAVGALSWAVYERLGAPPTVLGTLILALSFLYSWRAVRLKAWPVVDVLSHVLMLSALLFLAGYTALGGKWEEARLPALGVALISAYGQLYNQLRDYFADRRAGLRNTAALLGQRGTRWAMWGALTAGIACLGAALISGELPLALTWLIGATAPLAWLGRSHADMRGTPAVDATGRLQTGAMLSATLALGIWALWALWLR